jgi:hypothetical protein
MTSFGRSINPRVFPHANLPACLTDLLPDSPHDSSEPVGGRAQSHLLAPLRQRVTVVRRSERTGTVNAWSLAYLRTLVRCFVGITSCDRN